MLNPIEIIDKLSQEHTATGVELLALLTCEDPYIIEALRQKAQAQAQKTFGNKIYLRGLIEFSNFCKNDCLYCGIRRSNKKASRYRLTPAEILECCATGYELGLRTFVLQGGEDFAYDDKRLAEVVALIKKQHPDCAVTLSAGERSPEVYQMWYEAGVDRYLLRHETASSDHYEKLHPAELKLATRLECLQNLKSLGYQVGTGFMVGSPFQNLENLVEDLLFLKKFNPHMVGIGPFIPHKDTPFGECEAGSAKLTLKLLSIIRLLLPQALIPATTALNTLLSDGHQQGIWAGANVIMPNLSPQNVRDKYNLYDNKKHSGSEAAEGIALLRKQLAEIGYEIAISRGDYPGVIK